jgi:hypothetical protein
LDVGTPDSPEHRDGADVGADVKHDGVLRGCGQGLIEAAHVNFAEQIERGVVLAMMPYLTVPELEWRYRSKIVEMVT